MPSLARKQLADSAKVILPTLIAFLIFAGAVFVYFLPAYQQALLDRKRDSLRELTGIAVHILGEFQSRERSGELTRTNAQRAAIGVLRQLRYGPNDDEYFWINGGDTRLIMHPYRPDMEGRPLTDYTDPRGKKIFVEFVAVATRHGEGYVDYMWQWHGDAARIVPKLSHVRLFRPWQWVVGTGMYIDDVHKDIADVARHVYQAGAFILMLLSIIVIYIIRGGMIVALARQRAEAELQRHQDSLERTITERTAELRTANAALAKENAERRALEDILRQLSCGDELTGLLNRRGFINAAETRLAEAERTGEALYLIYADLDNLKYINDQLGHATGDRALETFARMLLEDFRAGDISGRLGGDEFAVLLTGGADYSDERQIVERVRQLTAARNRKALGFKLEVSVGVIRYVPGSGQTLESLLTASDASMYADKQAKKNRQPPKGNHLPGDE